MKIDVRQWTWYWKFTWTILVIAFGICLWHDNPQGVLVCVGVLSVLVIPGCLLRIGRRKREFFPGSGDIYEFFIGHVDKGDGRHFRCTTFRNEHCDDPRLVLFERSDFDRCPEDGEWFRGVFSSTGIRLQVKNVDELVADPDEYDKEFKRLLKELPEEF